MPEKLPPDNPDRKLDQAVRPDSGKKPPEPKPTLPRGEKGAEGIALDDDLS